MGYSIKAYKFFDYGSTPVEYLFTDDRNTPLCYVKERQDGKYLLVMFDKKTLSKEDGLMKRLIVNGLKKERDNAPNGDLKRYVESVQTVDEKRLTDVMLKNVKMSPVNFKERFFHKEMTSTGEVSYGRWRIVPQEGVGSAGNALAIIKNAERKLGSQFSKLCYGDVYVVSSIKSNVLADYTESDDSIRIRNVRGSDAMTLNLLHELGHRLCRKFLSANQKEELKEVYDDLKQDSRAIELKPGDVVELAFTDITVKVNGVSGNQVSCEVIKSEMKKYKVGERVLYPKNAPVERIRSINGKVLEKGFAFPSMYSKVSAEEFFCESFSLWRMGKLDRTMSGWLSELL